MPIYIYKVRDKSGKILKGQMEAADGRELRKKLDERDFFIVEYSEKKSKKDLFSSGLVVLTTRVKLKEISIFSWQLYTMLDAGMPLVKGLKIIANQTKNEQFRFVINSVCHRVEEGSCFSDALKEHPYVFPKLFVQVMNAGEVGGVLDEMLKRMAAFYENQVELEMKIKSALTYPAVLIFVSLTVVVFLITVILPRFSNVFTDMGATIPLLTRIFLGIGVCVKKYWYIIIGGLGLGFVGFWGILRTEKGKYLVDKIALNLPIFGDLVRKTTAARFTQTLSILIRSGITILTALEVVTETIGNAVIVKTLKEAHVMVGEGKPLAQPLEQSGIFPDMVVDMITVGEETGSLEKMLGKVAEFYQREVENAISNLTKLIEPLLIVFMTLVIGIIAMSIFLPMTDMMDAIRHG